MDYGASPELERPERVPIQEATWTGIVRRWSYGSDARRINHAKIERRESEVYRAMLLLPTGTLPDSPDLLYEIKLDGYRAIAFKTGGRAYLRSRNNKDFNRRYPAITKALAAMPDETVIDGEVVALDGSVRPSFNALENYSAGAISVVFYAFDAMVVEGQDLMAEPLTVRREALQSRVLVNLGEPIRESPELDASLPDLIRSVRAHGLEGLVAKRRSSPYEPGQRSGSWQKMRVNRAQDFVIAGYTLGSRGFDALIFGYFDGAHLIYVGRTRSGFM